MRRVHRLDSVVPNRFRVQSVDSPHSSKIQPVPQLAGRCTKKRRDIYPFSLLRDGFVARGFSVECECERNTKAVSSHRTPKWPMETLMKKWLFATLTLSALLATTSLDPTQAQD